MVSGHRPATDRRHVNASRAAIGRAAVKGAVVGFVVVLTYFGSIALAADAGLISALGVGAFAALWRGHRMWRHGGRRPLRPDHQSHSTP